MTAYIISRLYGMSSLEDVYEARRDVGKNNVASVCRRLVSLTRTSPGWPLSALNRNQPSTTLQQHLLLSDSQAELAENKLPGFESYLTSRTSQNLPQSLVPLPQIQTTGVSSGSNSFHCQRLRRTRGEADVVVHGASDGGGSIIWFESTLKGKITTPRNLSPRREPTREAKLGSVELPRNLLTVCWEICR